MPSLCNGAVIKSDAIQRSAQQTNLRNVSGGGGDVLGDEDGRPRRLSAQAAYVHLAGRRKRKENTANVQIMRRKVISVSRSELWRAAGRLVLTGDTLCLVE